MSFTSKQISVVASVFVALACAVGVYWYLSSQAESTTHDQNAAQGPRGAPADGKPWARLRAGMPVAVANRELLSRSFDVMNTRPERMPQRLQDKVNETLGAPAGALELNRAQYVSTATGGAWIAYGQGIVCLVQAPHGNVACESVKGATKHGVMLGLGNLEGKKITKGLPSDFLVVGLAPDSVRSVRVRVGAKDFRTLPIRDNVYSLRASEIIVVKDLER